MLGHQQDLVDIPVAHPWSRLSNVTEPQFPALFPALTHNAGEQLYMQGVDHVVNSEMPAPCLAGPLPMLDIIPCDMGCGQYLVLKDGKAFGHVSKDALSLPFRGNGGGALVPQDQFPSDALAHGVVDMSVDS